MSSEPELKISIKRSRDFYEGDQRDTVQYFVRLPENESLLVDVPASDVLLYENIRAFELAVAEWRRRLFADEMSLKNIFSESL